MQLKLNGLGPRGKRGDMIWSKEDFQVFAIKAVGRVVIPRLRATVDPLPAASLIVVRAVRGNALVKIFPDKVMNRGKCVLRSRNMLCNDSIATSGLRRKL